MQYRQRGADLLLQRLLVCRIACWSRLETTIYTLDALTSQSTAVHSFNSSGVRSRCICKQCNGVAEAVQQSTSTLGSRLSALTSHGPVVAEGG